MHLMTLNEQLGEYFGAPNNEGVLVEEVEKGSTAEKAGVKAGDIIVRVGTKTVDGVEKIQKELRKYDEGEKIDIEVLRKGAKKTFSIEMEEDQAFFKNFHFPKHRIRIFRGDPFDDAALRLDMDELRSNVEQAEYELQESLNSLDGIPQDISGPSPRFDVPHREHSKLRL
jgi:membrane-associated protease RseP (regulator of RpoE activity)